MSKATSKKEAPKKSATETKETKKVSKTTKTEEANIDVKPHGKKFLVTKKSDDGGVWNQSIEETNPLEEGE